MLKEARIEQLQTIGEMAKFVGSLLHAEPFPVLDELPAVFRISQDCNRLYENIRAFREEKEQMIDLAYIDQLTGLPNRRQLDAFLNRSFLEARKQNKGLCSLMIDLDEFKAINDNHGHHIGDHVLTGSADALHSVFRGADLLARYGGDEFIAILPGSGREGGLLVAERALELLRNRWLGRERQLRVTASIGVAFLTEQDRYPEEIMKRSDKAVYRAKRQGGNRVCVEE